MALSANSPLLVVKDFFEMDEEQFSAEWKNLGIPNKKHLLTGIRNGSLTY